MTICVSQYNHNVNKTICKYHNPSTNVLFDYFKDMLRYEKRKGQSNMYKVLAAFDGVLIALMVAFNGLLASHIGNEQGLMVIHRGRTESTHLVQFRS